MLVRLLVLLVLLLLLLLLLLWLLKPPTEGRGIAFSDSRSCLQEAV